jgi:uncharacterized membrane protein
MNVTERRELLKAAVAVIGVIFVLGGLAMVVESWMGINVYDRRVDMLVGMLVVIVGVGGIRIGRVSIPEIMSKAVSIGLGIALTIVGLITIAKVVMLMVRAGVHSPSELFDLVIGCGCCLIGLWMIRRPR